MELARGRLAGECERQGLSKPAFVRGSGPRVSAISQAEGGRHAPCPGRTKKVGAASSRLEKGQVRKMKPSATNHAENASPTRSPVPAGFPSPLSGYGDLLTVDDMAELLDTSTRTIYRLCDRDELPFRKIGRRLYFPKHEMIGFLGLEGYCVT